ncbi:MAG: DUF308 domain-containing protein [Eubacteriales bacterium]
MKLLGMIIGGLVTAFGLSIMFTPLRTYFLLGWIIGLVLLCNGVSMLGDGLRKSDRSLSKILVGTVTALIGTILLVSDFQQILTQIIIVYLVAGGILVSGLIECIIGYALLKNDRKGVLALIIGATSVVVGIAGLVFQNATVTVIGFIVGYHIVRIGLNIFLFARSFSVTVEPLGDVS